MKEIIVITLASVAVSMAIMAILTGWTKGLDQQSCYSFGNQANREVRFVTYTYMNWDCITPTKDGKWISTNMLRDIN